MNWILVALGGYLAAQLMIGAWLAPRIKTQSDYLIGGRSLGYPLTVFSMFATWFGAETCLSSAGRAYSEGFSLTSAEPFAYGLTIVVMGLVFAVPLWRLELTTVGDFYRMRFGAGVEKLAVLMMIPSGILFAAAQLRGFGHVLTAFTSLDIGTAVTVAALFCITYTTLGGLLADAITDLMQGLVLIVGLGLLVIVVIAHQGGIGASLGALDTSRIVLVGPDVTPTFLAMLEEFAIPIAGSVVAADLLSRAIAARSPHVARNGALLAGGMYIAVGIMPVFLGLAAYRFVPNLADAEMFLPALALQLLPSAGYVLFLGALISAILSTVDTILLVAGGLAARNVVAPLLGIRDDLTNLRMARAGVLVFGAIALYLALGGQGIAELVEQASSFGTAGILVVMSAGLFTRAGGSRASSATLLGGLASYALAATLEAPYPFLTSVVTSIAIYGAVAMTERTPEPAIA